SLDPLPSKVTGTPATPPEGPSGPAIAARSSPPTSSAVAALPDRVFDAVKTTVYDPDCAKLGVQSNVPETFPRPAANVAPSGSGAAAREAMASPSGSAAETAK